MRRIGLHLVIGLGLVLGLGLGSGCAHFATIEVVPSGCVNPAGSVCPSSGNAPDSRILELRLYQLKDVVDPCKLDYNAFVDAPDKDFDLLKSQLADPQRKEAVRRIEQIEAAKTKPLARWALLPETRYLLAVAVGRTRGKNSLRMIAREDLLRHRGLTVYIRGTNLCLANTCENSMEEQCP